MKESANDKRVSLITEIINLSDEQVLETALVNTSEPDATTKSHEGTDHPNEPPPGGSG